MSQADLVTELNPGLHQEHSGYMTNNSGYMTNSSLGTGTFESHVDEGAVPKKKAPGLKKKLTSKVSAARADASLG